MRDIEDRDRNEDILQKKLDCAKEEIKQKSGACSKLEQRLLECEKALRHKKEKLEQERVAVGELKESLGTARNKIAVLEAERAGLMDDMSSQRSTVELSSANVTQLENQLEHLNKRIQELEPKLQEAEMQLEHAQEEKAGIAQLVTKQQDELGKLQLVCSTSETSIKQFKQEAKRNAAELHRLEDDNSRLSVELKEAEGSVSELEQARDNALEVQECEG